MTRIAKDEPETETDQPQPSVPVAVQRLLNEVRNEQAGRRLVAYNRMHNRHNRD